MYKINTKKNKKRIIYNVLETNLRGISIDKL